MMMAIPGIVIAVLMMLIGNAMLKPGQQTVKMDLKDIILLMLAGPFGTVLAVVMVAKRM